MNKSKMQILSALIAIMLVFSSVMAVAQISRGAVTGAVTDPSGAVVAKATVTLTEVATNVARTTETNGAGLYRFDAVNLGDYRISVDAPGFSKAAATNVGVAAGRTANFDFQLKPGSAATEVTVEGSGVEALQTSEQVRGESISARSVANLPLVGQNSLNLLLTVPGVITTDQGGSTNSGIGAVNGARPRSNSFLIDGVENNDISVNGPALAPTNNDAIQEVSIQTSNFSSEFGRAGGAVVNQITKSGTNGYHGTAAWVYKTENFNARSRTERAGTQAKFLEHIPALTFGGPVVIPHLYDGHNRTFFFAGAQWDRFNSGSAQSATFRVPTAAGVATLQALATAGCTQATQYLTFLDGLVAPRNLFVTGTANPVTVDLSIPAATFAATGSCNGTARAGQTLEIGTINRAVPSLFSDNNHVVRIDHKISDKHQINGRWLYDVNGQNNGGSIAVSQFGDADFTGFTDTALFTDTYVFSPTVTNEFRVNYGRINFNFPLHSTSALTQNTPTISFASSSSLSSYGASATFPQGRTANNYQYQDTVTIVRGKHQFRMGADYLRQLARQTAPANVRGNISYAISTNISGFANYLDNFSGNTATPVGIVYGTPTYRPNLFRQAYFFQDSWRVKDDLTLNLGLRYENFGQPANIFTLPVVTNDPTQFGVPSKVNTDNNNFGPTVGFAWSPRNTRWSALTGDGKMVIRGGFQTTYDTFFNNMLSNMAAANPNLVANANPVVPAANPRGLANISGIFSSLTPAPLNPLTNASSQFSKNIVSPYTNRFSLGVQREMPWKMIMDVSYVGALTRKQFRTVQTNPLLPNATNTGSGVRMDPTIGSRTPRISNASSNYNGLQVELKRGFSNTIIGGISFDSSYTWSKSLDIVSEIFATNPNPGTQGSSQRLILTNPKLDYGPSDFDVRHAWVSTILWDVKGPKNGIMGQAFGGWSLSYVIPIQSGSPFDVVDGFDRDWDGGTADRPDIGNLNAPLTSRAYAVTAATCASGLINIDTKACTTASDVHFISYGAQNLGGGLGTRNDPNANTLSRNAVRTPGSVLVHMNVIKTFRIKEGYKLEYRAEIFNLANHENFNYTPVGTTVGSCTLAAVLSPTGTCANFLDYNAGRPSGDFSSNARNMRMGLKFMF